MPLFAVLTLVSCHYKEFDDYDGSMKVKVVMDYSGIDSVASRPSGMKVVFYSDGMSFSQVCYVRDSAIVDIPAGNYNVVTYNEDSEINRYGLMEEYGNAPVIYTDEAGKYGLFHRDSLDTAVYYDFPDRLFSDTKQFSLNGTPCLSDYEEKRIVLSPRERTRRVEVAVDGIKNQKYITSLRMSLDGIQRRYVPPFWQVPESYVPIAFESVMDGGGGRITGSLNVFGFDSGKHYLQLFVEGSGYRRLLRFDVTEQVLRQLPAKGTVRIYVNTDYDAFDDYPVDINGGIKPGVEDWTDEEISTTI